MSELCCQVSLCSVFDYLEYVEKLHSWFFFFISKVWLESIKFSVHAPCPTSVIENSNDNSRYNSNLLFPLGVSDWLYSGWNDVNCGNTNEMNMWPSQWIAMVHIFIAFVFPQFTSFHSVFHSFYGLMNSINWPAFSVWVFIAQLVEHCSANSEATLKSRKTFFFRATSQLLKLRFTGMVTYSFHLIILLRMIESSLPQHLTWYVKKKKKSLTIRKCISVCHRRRMYDRLVR